MTIEAGVLSLRIQEQGADQVLSKLDAIDKKAMAMGKAMSSPSGGLFNPQTATAINGQMGQMAVNFQRVTKATDDYQGSVVKLALAHRSFTQQQQANPLIPNEAAPKAQTLGSALQSLALKYITLQAAQQLAMRAVSATVGFLDDQIEAGDAMHDFAIRTGVSVESLDVMGRVAKNANASINDLVVGFRALNIKTSEAKSGNKEAIEAFARIGISVDDLRGKNPEQVFLMVANGIAKYGDEAFQAEEAQKLLGRGGNVLITTMQELANGGFERAKQKVNELGGAMTDQFANKADGFKDKIGDMHTALAALGRAIDLNILPPMTALVDMVTRLVIRFGQLSDHPTVSSGLAGFLSQIPGGAFIAAMLPGLPGADFSGVAGGSSSTSPFIKKAPPIITTASQLTEEEKAAIRERKAALKKAAALDGFTMADIAVLGLGTRGSDDPFTQGVFGSQFDRPGTAGPRIAPTVGVDSKGQMKGVKDNAQQLIDKIVGKDKELAEKINAKKEFINGLLTDAGMIVGGAFGAAFSAAFQDGGNFFEAFGKSLLSGLGSIIMQLGEQMIAYAAIITPLTGILGPFAGIAGGGPMTLAAGIALTALGAAMGAAGGGGKGGGKGGGSSSSNGTGNQQDNTFALAFDPDRKLRKRSGPAVIPSSRALDSTSMPEGRANVTVNATIIGPDDPHAQTQIAKLVKNATLRGKDTGLMKKAG